MLDTDFLQCIESAEEKDEKRIKVQKWNRNFINKTLLFSAQHISVYCCFRLNGKTF